MFSQKEEQLTTKFPTLSVSISSLSLKNCVKKESEQQHYLRYQSRRGAALLMFDVLTKSKSDQNIEW